MRAFEAADWFEIGEHGRAAVVRGIEGFDPLPLIGHQVEMDGKAYLVNGVEWNLVRSVGESFALLVDTE